MLQSATIGFMAANSIPLRYRLTPSYRDQLQAYADSERWSIALAARVIIEEFLDKRDAAPEAAEPARQQAAVLPSAPPVLLGVERDADRFLVVLRQALIDKGFDKIDRDGVIKRVVQRDDLYAAYFESPSRLKHNRDANHGSFGRCLRTLISRGVADRDGGLIWLTTP